MRDDRDPHRIVRCGRARHGRGALRARDGDVRLAHGRRLAAAGHEHEQADSSARDDRPRRSPCNARPQAESLQTHIGSLACSRVPSPTGLSIASVPPTVATRSSSPRRPAADGRIHAAHAVVGDPHDERLGLQPDLHPRLLGLRVARDVRQRLRDQEVRGGLDRRGQPLLRQLHLHLHRHRRPLGERVDRRGEPAVGEDRGMDAARELAQLRQRARQPLRQLVDRRVLQPRLEHPQVQRERDELLLRAVVQVALDPAPRGVAGRHDPRPREPQLLQPRLQIRAQALVVQRQRGGRRGGLHQLLARVQRGVVDDRREPPAVALHRRPGPSRPRRRQRHVPALLVDELLPVGQPVGDGDRAVAEALREQLAHRPGRARCAGRARPA